MADSKQELKRYHDVYEGELDIASIISVIWKHRKFIIFGTLFVTFIIGALSYSLPKIYLSKGYFQLGAARVSVPGSSTPQLPTAGIGVPLVTFKNSSTQFYNFRRLKLYHQQAEKLNEDVWKDFFDDFKNPEKIKKNIKPVYAYSKEDEQLIGKIPSDEKNSVIGIDLSYEAVTPQQAHDLVGFLGDYIKDCLLYSSLYEYVQNGFATTLTDLANTENNIIENRFQLEQNNNKVADIRQLLKKYPGSARIEDRQVVSIQDGGYHYLSPTTQLVGIESNIADIRRSLASNERDREKLTINKEFFFLCKTSMEKSDQIGYTLFNTIESIKDDLFKSKDMKQDIVSGVYNRIDADLLTISNKYENFIFSSGPSIPDRHFKPNRRKIVVITFFISLNIFTFLTFVLEWWIENRETVKKNDM
jgi:hypothetical protein